jgi:hypothetical protein
MRTAARSWLVFRARAGIDAKTYCLRGAALVELAVSNDGVRSEDAGCEITAKQSAIGGSIARLAACERMGRRQEPCKLGALLMAGNGFACPRSSRECEGLDCRRRGGCRTRPLVGVAHDRSQEEEQGDRRQKGRASQHGFSSCERQSIVFSINISHSLDECNQAASLSSPRLHPCLLGWVNDRRVGCLPCHS